MSDDNTEMQNVRRISSPEQLNDYLKVTNPKIWILLAAVVLFIAGFLAWGSITSIESYATGTARAVGGELTVTFDDSTKASNVKPAMEMEVGDMQVEILTVGTDADGKPIASAQARIPDGLYSVRVGYKATQVISMLLSSS